MIQYSIRLATIGDKQSVSDLLQASYSVLMPAAYDPKTLSVVLPAITQANPALLTSGSFYLAEIDNRSMIGCGGWTPERPGDRYQAPGVGHIRHFATHPDWVGKGVGRAIYQRCEHQARAASMKTLECYSSLNAELFYRALGFCSIERIQTKIGTGQNLSVVHMRRAL